ncbi:putative membrane protein [Mycobacterium xenopi 4042]|uniref:Putative membrane protein n=1 Tax=Mycobacterium xenopi 4042 TaxID=1299334 RepID=X7ZUW3_MYCXE|nr:putative membrane protein [Mycobacterium xenopi 4042]
MVLAGITLIGAGMATFAYGVATRAGYLPVLLAALLLMGMGLGCTTMPLVAAAVQSLAPHQIARGSALVHVNLQVAASISTAVMSVLLTSQLDHSKEHAYTTVFVVAAVLAVLAYIPAAFLPKKPVTAAPGLPPMVTP